MVKCIACGSENVRKKLRYRCEACGKISAIEELNPIVVIPDPEELDWIGAEVDEEEEVEVNSAYDYEGNLYFRDDEGNIYPSDVDSCCPSCLSDQLTLWGLYECLNCGKKFDEIDLFNYYKEKYSSPIPTKS